jgi:glycine cleavage system transcriptional repressor
MNQHIILTAIGADRPGLVDEVTEFIFQRGGNLEDSRMVNLRGQFAMMVLIGADRAAAEKISGGLSALASGSGLHAELHVAGAAGPSAARARPYRMTASAMDQSGLVHRVSHLLRSLGVNIESLETQLRAAPITGAPVFDMTMTLSVPKETLIHQLRDELGTLCDGLNIDWELTAV